MHAAVRSRIPLTYSPYVRVALRGLQQGRPHVPCLAVGRFFSKFWANRPVLCWGRRVLSALSPPRNFVTLKRTLLDGQTSHPLASCTLSPNFISVLSYCRTVGCTLYFLGSFSSCDNICSAQSPICALSRATVRYALQLCSSTVDVVPSGGDREAVKQVTWLPSFGRNLQFLQFTLTRGAAKISVVLNTVLRQGARRRHSSRMPSCTHCACAAPPCKSQ